MKHYEVEHHGLSYTVQLHPDTAEAIGAEPVVKDKEPNQKKNVSSETPSEPDTPGSGVDTEE